MERYVDISKHRQLTFDKLRTRERIANDLEGSSVLLMLLTEITLKRNQKMFRTLFITRMYKSGCTENEYAIYMKHFSLLTPPTWIYWIIAKEL